VFALAATDGFSFMGNFKKLYFGNLSMDVPLDDLIIVFQLEPLLFG